MTSGRSRTSMATPIPATSPSSSIVVKRPWEARQAMIRSAIFGPIPGSSSNAEASAVLRFTGTGGEAPDTAEREGALTPAPAGAGAPRVGTTICSPSTTIRARFTPVRSAPGTAPPHR